MSTCPKVAVLKLECYLSEICVKTKNEKQTFKTQKSSPLVLCGEEVCLCACVECVIVEC